MSTIYYYPHVPFIPIEEHPFLDLMYDLELITPPHTKYKSSMSLCPAMQVNQTHSYLLRSPINMTLNYNRQDKRWTTPPVSEELYNLITLHSDGQPYLQLGVHYLFWSEKKSNTQLWMHDAPLHEVNEKPSWYVASGMIPIGEYTRNTSLGIILKPNETKVKIERGQPVAAFTFVDNQKVKLVKKKPPKHILDANSRNHNAPKFCPYLSAKTLFSRWL